MRRALAPFFALPLVLSLMPAQQARGEFVSTPVTTAQVGSPYVYEVEATGTGEVEITAPLGLPPWLTLTPTGDGTATLSGTPGPGDTGDGIVLRAEDLSCRVLLVFCYEYQSFDITITQNAPPEVVAPGIGDQSAVEGEPFSLDLSAAFEDPDGDALTFRAAGLPSSLTLSGSVITGTPTNDDALESPVEVTVTADDGRGGRAQDTFTLTITPLARADLSLASIEAAPNPAVRGETVEWTFTIANAGPGPSGNVSLAIELAGNPMRLGEHPCALTVAEDRQRLECTLDPIADGEEATFVLTGAAAQVGDAYLTAEVAPLGERSVDPAEEDNVQAASLNVGETVSAEPAQTLDGAGVAAAAGDVDADGYDGLILATEPDAPAALHLNLEDPGGLHESLADEQDSRHGLSAVPLSLGDAAPHVDVAFADFDNDGDLDAVVANGAGAAADVFLNDGDGALTPFTQVGEADADVRAVAAADFNGDSYADLAFANAAGPSVVYLNEGGAGFGDGAALDGEARASVDVASADIDGDGLPELVFANADGPATLFSNDGTGVFAPGASIETGPTSSVAAGDFNADGFADLVFGRSEAGPSGVPANPVYLNNASGGFVAVAALGATPTLDVLVADFDADGALDIASINSTGAHQLFMGDGNGGFDLNPALLVSPGATKAAAGRFGMRETTDIAIAGADGTRVFFNDGRAHLGLGDTERPVIELNGEAEITLEVDASYEDAGATAHDDVDGELTPDVDNPVDTKVIGTYTVTYTAMDSAGNAATPVTRTVRVQAREASGGGGGGATGPAALALLLVAAGWRKSVRHRFPGKKGV